MNKDAIEKFFKPLTNYWTNLSKKNKITYIVVASVILIAIIIAVLLLNKTEYTVLYSNLQSQEAGEILNKLTEEKVDAKAQGTGTILVPKKQAESLRMELSAEGYPQSGLNYDIFKNSTGFGTTDYEKQKYMQFQLQDRMQNSIKSLDNVQDAIVTLNMPENSSFVLEDDKQKASASVIVKTKNNQKMTDDQIRGIEGLITKSVPGLTEDQVFIVDGSGNTLNQSGSASSTGAALASNQLELENNISNTYKTQIENMLAPVIGVGKVVAGVRVSLDFDKKTTETTTYSPVVGKEGIAASVNESKEQATNNQNAGVAGQDANGGAATTYPETNSGNGEYKKSTKTTNYEINQVKEMLEKNQGSINNISVSIILDSKGLKSGAEQKVKDIVAGATGIDPADVVVQTMQFNSKDGIDGIFNNVKETNDIIKKKANLRNAIIYAIAGVILLAVVLILMIRRRKKQQEEEYSGFDAIVADTDDILDTPESTVGAFTVDKSEERKRIEETIDKNPEIITQLLRNWLDEDRG